MCPRILTEAVGRTMVIATATALIAVGSELIQLRVMVAATGQPATRNGAGRPGWRREAGRAAARAAVAAV